MCGVVLLGSEKDEKDEPEVAEKHGNSDEYVFKFLKLLQFIVNDWKESDGNFHIV